RGLACVDSGGPADTAEFAAAARGWGWRTKGQWSFPEADELLLLADAGGSNSGSRRLWKQQVQLKLADRWGLAVTVCHYPTGASKWNPVEHRLFSPISINWAGEPLRNLETLLSCIRGSCTEAGWDVERTLGTKKDSHWVTGF